MGKRGVVGDRATRTFNFLLAALPAATAASRAFGDERHWVGNSGNWNDPVNWAASPGGNGGAGMPNAADGAFIRPADAIDRSIVIAPPIGQFWQTEFLSIASTGTGNLEVRLPSGALVGNGLSIGSLGRARFVQGGGIYQVQSLSLGDFDNVGAGVYRLEGGTLAVTVARFDRGNNIFEQTGGLHTVGAQIHVSGSSRYLMSGGSLITDSLGTDEESLFHQTGGTVQTDALHVSSEYRWSAGTLDIKDWWFISGKMSFPTSPTSLEFNGRLRLDQAELTNASNLSLSLGPNSVITRPAGFNPQTVFAQYSNAGLDHVAGTTLLVPPGRNIAINAPFEDDIDNYGSFSTLQLQGAGIVRTGSTLDATVLYRPEGTLRILGGTVVVDRALLGTFIPPFGGRAPSVIDQSAGEVQIRKMWLGGDQGVGSYRLSGGRLDATDVEVGAGMGAAILYGPGDFFQSGGEHHVLESLKIAVGGPVSGAYVISGGTLNVPLLSISHPVQPLIFGSDGTEPPTWGHGMFDIAGPDARINVGAQLSLGQKATFNAVPGATIHLLGADFINHGTDTAALAGLANLRIVAQSGDDSPEGGGEQDVVSTFEVAGKDVGAVPQGFEDNFLLGTLQVGGDSPAYFALVDNVQNQITDVPSNEALYVDHLILNAGSTLDLNGLNLYARNFTDNGGVLLENGGTLSVIPEPASLALLFPLLMISRPRRRG